MRLSKPMFAVWAPQIVTVVEQYNLVRAFLSHAYVTVTMDEALHDIHLGNLDIERPTHIDLNRFLAQTISSLTA